MSNSQFAYAYDDGCAPARRPDIARNVRMVVAPAHPTRMSYWTRVDHAHGSPVAMAIPAGTGWVTMLAFNEMPWRADSPALALIDDRLTNLRDESANEGIIYLENSEADLRAFLAEAAAAARPALYLLDDGSLRAKWRNLQGEQIALQFSGDGYAQTVFFVQRATGVVARIVGRDTLEGALSQIRSLGLYQLLLA